MSELKRAGAPSAPLIEVGANPADIARNRALGAGLIDDPYPRYDELRETGPIHAEAISGSFGLSKKISQGLL